MTEDWDAVEGHVNNPQDLADHRSEVMLALEQLGDPDILAQKKWRKIIAHPHQILILTLGEMNIILAVGSR